MSTTIPSDNILVHQARLAVKAELTKKRVLKQPIAKIDPKTKEVYMEYGDGKIVTVAHASRGRYSDRVK